MLTIYRQLQYNKISVIEDNTFNNLPRLYQLWVWFMQMYNSILLIFVITNSLHCCDIVVNIEIVESKRYQWTDYSPRFVYHKKANKSQIINHNSSTFLVATSFNIISSIKYVLFKTYQKANEFRARIAQWVGNWIT